MDESTTPAFSRAGQCRKNAQERSARKRAIAFAALTALQTEGTPLTQASLARRAGVSTVFLRSHPDLLQAIAEAATQPVCGASAATAAPARDVVLASLQRRVDALHAALQDKETLLRHKQREMDRLYGKLAVKSPLIPAELQQQYQDVLHRLLQQDENVLPARR